LLFKKKVKILKNKNLHYNNLQVFIFLNMVKSSKMQKYSVGFFLKQMATKQD